MTVNGQEILEAALKLSPKDRGEIAEQLLESLPLDEDEDYVLDEELFDDDWEAELNRRIALNEPGIPWEVVKYVAEMGTRRRPRAQ
jgi:hypothetical protein